MEFIGNIYAKAELSAILIKANGDRIDYGILKPPWRHRIRNFLDSIPIPLPLILIVTNAGVNYMASDFASGGNSPTISGFKYHASGTGTTAASVTDTALQSDSGVARVVGTASNPQPNQYRTVATMTYTSSLAITEWGLFSAATGGTLWDRRVFSAINVANGDSIQFTYTLTINSGGP